MSSKVKSTHGDVDGSLRNDTDKDIVSIGVMRVPTTSMKNHKIRKP
jgi:hypothetical protein